MLGARWEEVNLSERLWTVPASRMKMKREHIVPLTEPALVVLRSMAVAGTKRRVAASVVARLTGASANDLYDSGE